MTKHNIVIGRFQPFHAGHKKLIELLLAEDSPVCIMIRNTDFSESDPYSMEERIGMIRDQFPGNERVIIMSIPDIEAVCFGREVGYKVRQVDVDEETREISASEIREKG